VESPKTGRLAHATRLRIIIGRLILWFTEAAMAERRARHSGCPYRPPYRPHGVLELWQWPGE